MSSLKEKTASGLFWSAMNSGMTQLLSAVIGIFLLRLLSPEDYGLVGMIAIFSAVATVIQESGFSSALINMEKPTGKDYNSVFWFSFLLGTALYLLLFFCAPLIADYYNQERLVTLCRVCFLSILLSSIGIVPSAYLNKKLIVKEATLVRIASLAVAGVVSVTMAIQGQAYWSIVGMQLTYVGLQSICKYFLIPWRPSFSFDFGPVRRMFGFSCKIMVTNVINQTSNNILSVVFGKLFPLNVVGYFTQGYKWENMASSLITGTISQVAQPVFASINNDHSRQLQVLRKMVRFTAFLSFPIMIALALVSHEFVMLVMTEKWARCIPVLQILCIGGAFLPLYQPLQNLIVSRGRSDIFMWCNICQILILLASILFSARYGFMAMVVTYSAFMALWLLVWQRLTQRIAGLSLIHLLKDTAPFLLASLFSAAVAWWIASFFNIMLVSFIIKGCVMAVLYYLVMRIAGAKIMDECIGYLFKRQK